MKNKHLIWRQLPAFPQTPHLPHKPNKTSDDAVADDVIADQLFFEEEVLVYEKMDGSNLGILWDGHAHVRNRNHILNKGFLGKTPALNQYRPIFEWIYRHRDRFQRLADIGSFSNENPPVIYAEWLYMRHGIAYDKLPELLFPFDVWDGRKFLSPDAATELLSEAGFCTPPLLYRGPVSTYDELEKLCNSDSAYIGSGDRRVEGVYIKTKDGQRFKMVRQDFERGKYFDNEILVRNTTS